MINVTAASSRRSESGVANRRASDGGRRQALDRNCIQRPHAAACAFGTGTRIRAVCDMDPECFGHAGGLVYQTSSVGEILADAGRTDGKKMVRRPDSLVMIQARPPS